MRSESTRGQVLDKSQKLGLALLGDNSRRQTLPTRLGLGNREKRNQ